MEIQANEGVTEVMANPIVDAERRVRMNAAEIAPPTLGINQVSDEAKPAYEAYLATRRPLMTAYYAALGNNIDKAAAVKAANALRAHDASVMPAPLTTRVTDAFVRFQRKVETDKSNPLSPVLAALWAPPPPDRDRDCRTAALDRSQAFPADKCVKGVAGGALSTETYEKMKSVIHQQRAVAGPLVDKSGAPSVGIGYFGIDKGWSNKQVAAIFASATPLTVIAAVDNAIRNGKAPLEDVGEKIE